MNDKILVTGGTGFLGRHVLSVLKNNGIHGISYSSSEYDLIKEEDVVRLYEKERPDIVIHLAACVGGIGINKKKPGTFFYKNLMMGTLMMEYARRYNVKKFVAIGTICAYPKFTETPFKEEDLWNGYPEETNAPYGLAKKMMLVQSQAYREEFGFNSIYLLPVNLYGPGDNFNPETSHVIPAIIDKCLTAKLFGDSSITLWGTGDATREFLYVEDAAEAIVLATLAYNESEPVNIGSGLSYSIKELATIIADMCEYKGEIIWDNTKPDGQPRRCLDITKAKNLFGFESKTSLTEGLSKTIEWYRSVDPIRITVVRGLIP
jgi:GDP-L-fucose synthase